MAHQGLQLMASLAITCRIACSLSIDLRVFNNPNLTVHFNTVAKDVVSNNKGQMSSILLKRVDTEEETVLEVKGLFYGIGHTPNSELLGGQVELDSKGYVLVKEGTATTSVEGVFAAGDVQMKQARNSNFQMVSSNYKRTKEGYHPFVLLQYRKSLLII